jgi:hypothetical protein
MASGSLTPDRAGNLTPRRLDGNGPAHASAESLDPELWQCSYQMGRPMPIGEVLEAAVPHRGHAAGWQARQKALPQEQQGA